MVRRRLAPLRVTAAAVALLATIVVAPRSGIADGSGGGAGGASGGSLRAGVYCGEPGGHGMPGQMVGHREGIDSSRSISRSGLVLHRPRHLYIRQQTSVINAIRAHLA